MRQKWELTFPTIVGGGSAFSQSLSNAITLASQEGHLLVAAGGNSFGNDNDLQPLYPASFPHDNIISVGGSTNRDSIASFSNFGKTSLDIFAPAADIYSTLPNDNYGYQTGTSMAAPMVTGAVVLLLNQYGIISAGKTKRLLFETADERVEMADKCVSGGRLNLSSFVKESIYFQKETNLPDVDAAVDDQGNWNRIGNDSQSGWISKHSPNGEKIWSTSYDNVEFHQIESINNQFYIGGKTIGTSSNGILICLDSAGNEVWNRQFQLGTSASSIQVVEKEGNELFLSGYIGFSS